MLTLELLDRRLKKGAPIAGNEVREAMEEVDRLDQILARLLAFGRPGFQNTRIQDVRPLIDRAIRLVKDRSERKSVELGLELSREEPIEADVDALGFEQILINLLTNAIDAAPEGSTVTVAVRATKRNVSIAVTDRGAGIHGNVREQVFTPYFTTKENGTGLGLAVSREIASHHGGTLEFESAGEGTTFVLRLPSRRDVA